MNRSPRPSLIRFNAMQVFRMPFALAIVTATGLLLALLGDDLWDFGSWLALSMPLGLVFFYLFHSSFKQRDASENGLGHD